MAARFELLYQASCMNVEGAREAPAHARQYGSPTILVDGQDVVHAVRVDFESRSGRVAGDGSVTAADVRSALATYGFEAHFPGEAQTDSAPLPESEKVGLGLPYVRAYRPNGGLLGSVVGNHVELVEQLLKGHVRP